LRLARYSANYADRWMLSRALVRIVHAISPYLVTLRSEGKQKTATAFAHPALQICKLSAWICQEVGDQEGTAFALLGALLTTDSVDSDAYRWALATAQAIPDQAVCEEVLLTLERAKKRWAGERVAGDYHGDTIWQIIQNMASGLNIDISDEND